MKKQKRTPLVGLDVSAKRLKLLSEAFPSVLDLSGASVSQLLALDPQMHITEAREVLERAKTVSVVTARLFRERRLSTGVRTAHAPDTGVKGMVQGPTYTDMFTPNWAEMCPPNAIEATTSPIAYLADLYREVETIEATAKGQSFPLATRRPDLAGLMLDHTALNQIVPTLTLANEILETSITQFLDDHHNGLAVDDALLRTRYPMGLPYERYQQQITYVLGRKKQSPGDAIRCTDIAYPYFKEPGVHSLRSDDAMQQDTGFGPEQQSLLLEAPYFPFGGQEQSDKQGVAASAPLRINPRSRLIEDEETRAADFFQRHYGVDDSGELYDIQAFCLRTGITTDELDLLLSVGPYTPTVSPNGGVTVAPIDGATFGSVYINGGTSPAIAIETLTDSATGADGSVVTVTLGHTLVNCTPDRFDRMNRMLRLAKWLKLPFDQVDRLLCSARTAERRTDTTDWTLTANTLRTLGLFQNLRDSHKVSAEEFATLISGLGLCGLGKEPAQFDRVFNSQALFPLPFTLDGQTFAITPASEADRRKIDQMCVALGMTQETYRFCAGLIQQAQGREDLSWSSPVVSAFYRLARLPRYLGINAIEAAALLELLDNGGNQLIATLAGIPHVATYQSSGNSDTLSTLHALVDFHQWMVENQWTSSMLCLLLLPTPTRLIATQTDYNLMQQMSQRLTSAQITDSSFAEIGASLHVASAEQRFSRGAPQAQEPVDWFCELSTFIHGASDNESKKGLVKYLQGETDTLFEEALSTRIQKVFDDRKESSSSLLPKLVNMIMRARGMQEALLMEGLGNYLSVPADLAKELLAWVGANREEVLGEVLRVASGMSSGSEPTLPIDDKVLQILAALSKRATITRHLSLSPALVAVFVLQPQWFALPDNTLSLPCVYILSQYAQMLSLSEHTEEQLLDYFRLISSSWPTEYIEIGTPDYEAQKSQRQIIRGGAAYKLGTFLRWGIREVLQAAAHANPDHGVVFNFQEFDLLVRMRLFEQEVGLDTQALLALGNLTPTSNLETYRHAAELALTSLNETLLGHRVEEVGQSLSSIISVSHDYLVANNPNGPECLITLTLHDLMDQPLPFVDISWSTDEGIVTVLSSTTDEQGRATTTLKSGTAMGVAHVVATYGLDEKVRAPQITIDCDEASLRFIDGGNLPNKGYANRRDALQFWVALVDQYGNLGRDSSVEWGTDLGEFQRYMTRTDQQGITRASLRSLDHGRAHVVAQLTNGTTYEFPVVEFISEPYFQYVRSNDASVIGYEIELECRVVEMNGQPVEGAVVKFETSVPALMEGSVITNADGIARVRYVPAKEGAVVIRTLLIFEGKTIIGAGSITIYPKPTLVKKEISSAQYILGVSPPVELSIWLASGGHPVPRVPVMLINSNTPNHSLQSSTNGSGLARFSVQNFQIGLNTLVIKEAKDNHELASFEVQGVEEELVITAIRPTTSRKIYPNFLSGYAKYFLNVKLVGAVTGTAVLGRKFKLVNLGVDLSLLDVTLPGIGTEMLSSDSGHDFSVSGAFGKYGDLKLGVEVEGVAEVHLLPDIKLGTRYVFGMPVECTGTQLKYGYYLEGPYALAEDTNDITSAIMHYKSNGNYIIIYAEPEEVSVQGGMIYYVVNARVSQGVEFSRFENGDSVKILSGSMRKGYVIYDGVEFVISNVSE